MTSVGGSLSARDVKPRTSTNKTDMTQTSPPGGASSYQSVQRFGFLREGRIHIRLNGTENRPTKGTRHSLHLLADGRRR